MERKYKIGLAIGAGALVAIALLSWGVARVRTESGNGGIALAGEAREGGLTVELRQAIANVRVREAKVPGRPIVLIDPGHGGRDPGATGVSGSSRGPSGDSATRLSAHAIICFS